MVQNYGYDLSGNVIDDVKAAYTATKHTVGQLVRAPGTILEAVANTAKGAGEGIQKTTKALPWVLIILAAGVGAYLLYAGKKGTKLIPG